MAVGMFRSSGPDRRLRGSKHRVQRIRARDHSSWGFIVFAAFLLVLLFVVVPWLASHSFSHQPELCAFRTRRLSAHTRTHLTQLGRENQRLRPTNAMDSAVPIR
jgi:hypothetical protein